MKEIQSQIRAWLLQALTAEYTVMAEEIAFTIPAERKFGDISTTLPFVLAKRRGEKPFLVGKRILELLGDKPEPVSGVELAGGGFLNFYLHRDSCLRLFLDRTEAEPGSRGSKVVVEHTSINPNKSAHIGHLRNSSLGDTLAKGYHHLGYTVEVQNYIDDTGIQMADVIWGLVHHEGKTLDEIKEIPHLAEYLWRLYPEVNQIFEANEEKSQQRREVHKRIEEKLEPEASVCRYVAHAVLLDHIGVMERIGIRYDLLVHESDIIARGLFTETMQLLKDNGIMYLSQDTAKQGCWVIHYDREKLEKIIIRSNGTITYVGKDIAYSLWKFGLLKSDFQYQLYFTYGDGQPIWSTGDDAGDQTGYRYTGAGKVINVIDVRQSYLQSLINQILFSLGHESAGRNFFHYAYEMVALTPSCVRELGLEITPEEEKKSYVEVSGRKGRAVRADELIETLVQKSLPEVTIRNPGLADETAAAIARQIAAGALRYFMIKFHLNTVIAFDFKEALNFDGDSGPYLQYSLVRLGSILQKLPPDEAKESAGSLSQLDDREQDLYWEIMLHLAMLDLQVEHALENMDISSLATYAYMLCQKMNHYYHQFPVIAESDAQRRQMRILLIRVFRRKMERLLNIMGIGIPPKM